MICQIFKASIYNMKEKDMLIQQIERLEGQINDLKTVIPKIRQLELELSVKDNYIHHITEILKEHNIVFDDINTFSQDVLEV